MGSTVGSLDGWEFRPVVGSTVGSLDGWELELGEDDLELGLKEDGWELGLGAGCSVG